jgi:hypothetical protein
MARRGFSDFSLLAGILDPYRVELLLNLVWFGLASFLGIAYTLHCARLRGTNRPVNALRARREFLTGLMAVLLLAAIALPIISLTDDLQAATAVTETDQALRALAHDSVVLTDIQSAVASLNLLPSLPGTWAEAFPNPWDTPPVRTQCKRQPAEQRPPPAV